uniref:Mannose receptor, C type 1b n=1 Tax=Nothobranchius furzeri TaxID=105023 RepID=A0A8C6L8C7_NOTFU
MQFQVIIEASLVFFFLDSPFSLINKATGNCLVKRSNRCLDVRWTTADRLVVTSTKKCLGAQGRSVGSEVNQYDCDETSLLQKWECKNNTLLALKGQNFYIEGKADESIVLSQTIGPNNHFIIPGTANGACSRTHRELYTLGGNAFGKICMFPFLYKDRWFVDCTTFDTKDKRSWCATETKYEHEQWGHCPTTSTDHWKKNVITGVYYQVNTQSALTWAQADKSCKQQAASLVSITDPTDNAFITGKAPSFWIGLVLDPEHSWQWSDQKPFRYLKWDAGNPVSNPGHNCAVLDSYGQYSWQSSSCTKKMGYICHKGGNPPTPSLVEQGFCSDPYIPYNGHCFHLQRTTQTWPDAQRECRKDGGDLVTINNVEDQSFVISQLGYASGDELWIGLNDRRTEGLFDWSDHATVTFTSWEFGKPTVSGLSEDCVFIRGENGNWADGSCDDKRGFICMKQSSTVRTGNEVEMDHGCIAGWKKHGSYCYFVGSETKTFAEAKEDCKTSNALVISVKTCRVDNAFLVSLVGLRPEKHFWIGLSNQNNIDIFAWTNTDSVRFTHWNAGMPGYQQGCVAMASGISAGLWDLLPCTNREKYICKKLVDGALPTAPPPTQTPPQCADGWTRVDLFWSKFFTGPRSSEKTWFEARDYCRAIGGDLLSIHSAAELHVGRGGGRAWIGLHVADPNAGYVWSDGSPVNYLHWSDGEPNNFNNDESCAEFTIHNWDESGSWNDLNCESYNDWLCQIRAGIARTLLNVDVTCLQTSAEFNTTADGWLVWRGKYYLISKMSKSMEDARQFCQQSHADLVSINSKEENIFLWKQVGPGYGSYYIGLSVDLDGSFWWMDGTPVTYTRWDEDQPNTNSFDQNYKRDVFTGYWRTSNCGREFMFICKRTNSPPANTTIAPTPPPKGGCPFSWTKFVPCLTFALPSTDPSQPDQPGPIDPNIYERLGNDSMKAMTQNLTWENAKNLCKKEKANLASLRNEWTIAYAELLAITLKAPLWIGLNKNQTGGHFRFIDGWFLNSVNWAEFEPSMDRPCVYIDVDGKWRTALCNQTMNSICMQSTDVPPTESTKFPGRCPEDTKVEYQESYTWLPFRGHCYLFLTEEIEWADAASSCVRHGGTLASIQDSLEQQFIKRNIEVFQDSHPSFWIGLYKTHKGSWLWLDKTVMDYVNWAPDEPDSFFGTIQTSDGSWSSGRSWHDKSYICKTPKGKMKPHGGDDPQSRVRTSLIVVMLIAIISTITVVAILFHGRSPRPFPTFENPLYFNNEQAQPDVVDTNKLIENVENSEPILTL